MTVAFDTMRTFFALAAITANVLTVAIVVTAVATRRSERNAFEVLRGATLWLASGVAIIATLGSLYLSESVGLVPCQLCWYQRIAMYPLAVILPIAAIRRDPMVRLPAATLATIGAGIAAYHRLIQAFPSLDSGSCSAVGPSCSSPLIKEFGFVTIPYMALSAFLLILAFIWVDRRNSATAVPSLDTIDQADAESQA
jgi:disulfide bond formation protein DsbB